MYRFIEEKQIEKIVLEYILNNNQMEDRCIDVLKVAFDQMISRILLQIKLYLENVNQFKKTETIYQTVQDIKKAYVSYIDHDLSELDNEQLVEIIQTICDVLEIEKNDFPIERENPLEYERTLIEALALLKAQEALNQLKSKSIREFRLPISIYNNYYELLTNYILSAYHSMQEDLKIIVDQHAREVNNYAKRVELLKYVQVVQEQKYILENFIHIDLNIDSNRFNEQANQLTREYIYPLREIYQMICSSLEDVDYAKKKCETLEYQFVVKNIGSIIENNIMNNSKLATLMEQVEMNKKNTIDLFLMHVNDELTKVSTRAVNNLKRVSHSFELINYSIIDHLSTVLMEVQSMDMDQIHNQHHLKIVRGVLDTLMLKYDIIKEKSTEFQLERKSEQLNLVHRLFEFQDEFDKKCSGYFEDAIQGKNSGFEKSQAYFDKIIHQTLDQAYENELSTLSKDLLFEIKSLEDIIQQSISVIQESEEQKVLWFANKVKQLYEMMIRDLKKYQVERIFPKPGEKFNGRMHEIILAETSTNHKKGEIIRTQNSGFIIKDRIITRASVVAAK